MDVNRRRQLLLGAVLVVLAVVVYRAWTGTSAGPAPASNGRDATARVTRGDTAADVAPDVHLKALEGERPKPGTVERNLFRFKPKAPSPIAGLTRPGMPGARASQEPSGPPPLPPINLKFIGVIEQGGGKPKIAILSDGIGPPMWGEEGKEVAGRYKILRIGVESIEMSYLDGRGRQTIRLTGGS